jgi:predicted translin family RNA/ssDNA-binding protein
MKKLMIAMFTSIALSSTVFAASKTDYEQAASAAKAAQEAAAAVKSEWRDTGKLLKEAAAAAEKGDYAKATELAKSAELQGKMGEQQAKEQAGIGNAGYLYN